MSVLRLAEQPASKNSVICFSMSPCLIIFILVSVHEPKSKGGALISKVLDFYPRARVDGLIKREEQINVKACISVARLLSCAHNWCFACEDC